MKFQLPYTVNADDKAKLKAAGEVIADAFPSVSVGWKPGRKALTAIGKAIPTVSVSWKDKAKPDSE
jgi:hypothetical protein